jgi:exodeoxyribonuclease VIII
MRHISFDLETLGNTPNAPIVQIGACKFDVIDGPNGGTIAAINVEETFLRTVKLSSLDKFDFSVDYETVGWWMMQSENSRNSVFNAPETVDIRQAIREFYEWIGQSSKYVYWSHATFDPPILANNSIKVGLGRPIPFRLFRDIRTLVHFAGKVDGHERDGLVHHNAKDDAIFQAGYIAELIGRINVRQEKGA